MVNFLNGMKTVKNKDIVVVRDNKHNASVQRIYINNGQYILYSGNSKYNPQIITDKETCIIGKVVSLTRQFD